MSDITIIDSVVYMHGEPVADIRSDCTPSVVEDFKADVLMVSDFREGQGTTLPCPMCGL